MLHCIDNRAYGDAKGYLTIVSSSIDIDIYNSYRYRYI